MYTVDLSINQIQVYAFDGFVGDLGQRQTALSLSPGDGPRHMVFHHSGHLDYIMSGRSDTPVFVEVAADGKLIEKKRLPTLPKSYQGRAQAGHIAINANGHDIFCYLKPLLWFWWLIKNPALWQCLNSRKTVPCYQPARD